MIAALHNYYSYFQLKPSLLKWTFLYLGSVLAICGCSEVSSVDKGIIEEQDYFVDTSGIPNDTVAFNDPKVSFVNGLYLYEGYAYSGIVFKVLKGNDLRTYSSVLKGQRHGTYRSFFKNGNPYEVRQYKNNLAFGKHYGFWEKTEVLKFEYRYFNEKKEGPQKNWYENGEPSYAYNYRDDQLEGLQRAWRRNGSLYRNFEVKAGVRYGLQKSAQCYGLTDEKTVQ